MVKQLHGHGLCPMCMMCIRRDCPCVSCLGIDRGVGRSLNRALSLSSNIARAGETYPQNTLHDDFTSIKDGRDALEEPSSVYPQHHGHETLSREHQLRRAEDVHRQAVLGNTIHLAERQSAFTYTHIRIYNYVRRTGRRARRRRWH